MGMADSQEKWKHLKHILSSAARLCRYRALDAPRSEDEKVIGLETRHLALARAFWQCDLRTLRILYQPWDGARELVEPDGPGFRARDAVLLEPRFHEALDNGTRDPAEMHKLVAEHSAPVFGAPDTDEKAARRLLWHLVQEVVAPQVAAADGGGVRGVLGGSPSVRIGPGWASVPPVGEWISGCGVGRGGLHDGLAVFALHLRGVPLEAHELDLVVRRLLPHGVELSLCGRALVLSISDLPDGSGQMGVGFPPCSPSCAIGAAPSRSLRGRLPGGVRHLRQGLCKLRNGVPQVVAGLRDFGLLDLPRRLLLREFVAHAKLPTT